MMNDPNEVINFTKEELKNEILMDEREQKHIREIDVTYCHHNTINEFLKKKNVVKIQFFNLLNKCKKNGKLIQRMGKISVWLENNIDSIYVKNP